MDRRVSILLQITQRARPILHNKKLNRNRRAISYLDELPSAFRLTK